MVILANAFSLNMLSTSEALISVREIGLQEVKRLISGGFTSAIGHQGTADVLSMLLDVDVPFNRVAVKVGSGDKLIVFQLLTRLEEGKVLSPEELKNLPYKFFLVEVL